MENPCDSRLAAQDGVFRPFTKSDAVRIQKPPGRKSKFRPSADIYDALGVSPSATDEEIRAAFYDRASALHPDRNGGDPKAAETFSALAKGAELLRDPRMRRLYDRGEIDATGRLTARGAARRKKAGVGQAVATYFVIPFVAGVAVLCATLWSRSPVEAAAMREADIRAESAYHEVADAAPVESAAAMVAPVAVAVVYADTPRVRPETRTERAADFQPPQPKAAHPPLDAEDFEAMMEHAASGLASAKERPQQPRASKADSATSTPKRAKRNRDADAKPVKNAAKPTVMARLEDKPDLPFSRKECRLTARCLADQDMCAC